MVRYGIPREWYASWLPGAERPLVECGCCYADCELENTVSCPSKHAFCVECVKRYANTQLGEHKPEIACMHSSGCKALFHRSVIQRILTPNGFKLYERLLQQKELREANIPNLEFCPRCDFAIIMEVGSKEEPLFRCLNVEEGCGKVTCRKCKRDNHWPRTCRQEELRRMGPERAVEEAMSEALMRRCPGCRRPSIKENGCNHIVCSDCRTHFCYHCRRDITVEGYNHFHRNVEHDPRSGAGANGRCLLWDETPIEDQHNREVNAARERATAEQLQNAQRAKSINIAPELQSSSHFRPTATNIRVSLVQRQRAQVVIEPPVEVAPAVEVENEPEPEDEIDLVALARAVEDARHELKLARRRQSYAAKQWGARHRLWSEARYQAVVHATEEYEEALADADHRYREGRKVKLECERRQRLEQRPVAFANIAQVPRRQNDVVQPVSAAVLVQPPVEEVQPEVPVVNLAALSDEVRCASHELKKARARETYARKQWGARHRLWSQDRYDSVVQETGRYHQLVLDAQRRYQEALQAAA